MYLLDTTIASLFDPRRREHAGPAIAWMQLNDRDLSLSTVTLIEIEAGLLKLRRDGKTKRAGEIEAFRDGLVISFADRWLPMDAPVALAVAHLAEVARPIAIEMKDLIIAATAKAHGLTVLTRNLRHFVPTGVPTLDPMVALPRPAH